MTTSSPSSTTWSLEPVRRGFVGGTWTTFRLSGLSLLRGRRGVLLGLLSLVPLLPSVISLWRDDGRIRGVLGFAEHVVVSGGPIAVLVALFLGCAVLGEERENGTLPYLLARPVPRTAILLGRYLSGVLCAAVPVLGFLVAGFFLCVAPMGREALELGLPVLKVVCLGSLFALAVYVAVCLLLSVLIKPALWVGLLLSLGWESWASTAPLPLSNYSVQHHVYVWWTHQTHLEVFLEQSSMDADTLQSGGHALGVLAAVGAIALAASLHFFRRREYAPARA